MPLLLLLLPYLLLTGCGFHPIYGSRDESTRRCSRNSIRSPSRAFPDRQGQTLRNELIDRMYGKGRPHNPKYHLAVTLRSTEEGIGLLPNAITTLTELTVYGGLFADGRKGQRSDARHRPHCGQL